MNFTQLLFKYLACILLAGFTLILTSCIEDEVLDPKKPKIIVNTIAINNDGNLEADVDFTDNVGLERFTLVSDDMNIDESQTITGTAYNFKKVYDLTGLKGGTYNIEIEAFDQSGNKLTANEEVTLVVASPPGEYSGDVYLIGDLAWFGDDATRAMPMEKDDINEGWYEITLFSAGGAENGIKFTGQKSAAPNNWGLVDASNPEKGMLNGETSHEIPVTAGGYHTIRFNPSTLKYEITAVDESSLPEPLGQMHIMGKGFVGHDLNWNLDGAIPMTQDEQNPYLYRIELEFSDAVDLKVNGNKAWDGYDCGFPETTPPNGNVLFVELSCGGGTKDYKYVDRAGTYQIVVDEYLKRASIVEVVQ